MPPFFVNYCRPEGLARIEEALTPGTSEPDTALLWAGRTGAPRTCKHAWGAATGPILLPVSEYRITGGMAGGSGVTEGKGTRE